MSSEPVNKVLYNRVKTEAKRRFKVWPSAYASGWVVKTYKARGGKYRRKSSRRKSHKKSRKFRKSRKKSRKKSRSPLGRWFAEKWIDVCTGKPCGRKSARTSPRKYPYCRPKYRISSKTPKTIRELSKAEIKQRCLRKRRSPHKRVN